MTIGRRVLSHPDGSFPNFRASKSVDQQMLCIVNESRILKLPDCERARRVRTAFFYLTQTLQRPLFYIFQFMNIIFFFKLTRVPFKIKL